MLKDTKIALFITGGIASYKMAELSRQLIKKGAEVRVAMSKAATEFISPLTFQVLTKHKVLVDVFDESDPLSVQHIELADWLDIALVAPATANIIGKIANGIADEIVSTTLMAVAKPKIIVPAMNTKMYENPANQRNLKTLIEDGAYILEPATGFLAEGYEGKGRLPDLELIVNFVEKIHAQNKYEQILEGKNILISAGGTKERIDPVRFISNDSSGKMGYAMAETATWLGANVTLVSTKKELPVPHGVEVIYSESALDLKETMDENANTADYIMMVAAVSDYRVLGESQQKIKKENGQNLTLELAENPDILKGLVANKSHQTIIGFSAETENLIENAKNKLKRKKVDWIIANQVGQENTGFNVDTNQVTLLSAKGDEVSLPLSSKVEIALKSWQTIAKDQPNKKLPKGRLI